MKTRLNRHLLILAFMIFMVSGVAGGLILSRTFRSIINCNRQQQSSPASRVRCSDNVLYYTNKDYYR